jgi:hypothetical protein
MMREAERRAANPTEHVKVGCFGGERQGEGGKRRLAVESGAA